MRSKYAGYKRTNGNIRTIKKITAIIIASCTIYLNKTLYKRIHICFDIYRTENLIAICAKHLRFVT